MDTKTDRSTSFFRTRAARWLTLAVTFAAVMTTVALFPKLEKTAVAQSQPGGKKSPQPVAAAAAAASETDDPAANPAGKTTNKKSGTKKSNTPAVARKRLSAVDLNEVDKLLPASPMFFIRWDGTASHGTAWEATAAYEAFVTSGLSDALDRLLGDLEQFGAPAQIGRAVAWHLLERGFSIASTAAIPNGDPDKTAPTAPFIAVIHGGAETFEQIRGLIPRASLKESDYSGVKVYHDPTSPVATASPIIWTSGKHLLVGASIEDLINSKLTVEGKLPNITQSGEIWKKLTTAESGSKKTIAGISWMQTARAVGLMKNAFVQSMTGANATQQPKIPAIDFADRSLELSGLSSLGTLTVQSGFDGKYSWTDTLLQMTGKPTGILSFLDQKPFTLAEIPPVTPSAPSIIAFSLDLGALFDSAIAQSSSFKTLMDEGGPAGTFNEEIPDFAALVKQADATLGFSIRDDLLASLGHIHCVYPDPDNGVLGYGGALVMQVRDPVRLRKVLQEALKLLPGEDAENPISVNSSEVDGFEIVSLTLPVPLPINPAICITDKWMVLGPNVPTVETFLDRLAERSPKWTPDEKTTAILSQFPAEFTCFTYYDPASTAKALYNNLPVFQSVLAAASRDKEFARPLKLTLPPIDKVRGPLVPTVSVTQRTESGLRLLSRGTSPTIPSIGAAEPPGIGTTAIMVALLLPAIQQAREAARMTVSRNNVKQITLAMHNYEATYHEFPPGALPGAGEPETRLSWLVGILPYLDENEMYDTIDTKKAFDAANSPGGFYKRISVFTNPSNPMLPPDGSLQWSHYAGIGGLGEKAPFDKTITKNSGIFSYNRATNIRDIKDGTANTIAVSEIRDRFSPWGQAGPGTVRALTKPPYVDGPDGFGGFHPNGMIVGFADGSVRFISQDVDDKVMEALSTIAGGKAVDLDGGP